MRKCPKGEAKKHSKKPPLQGRCRASARRRGAHVARAFFVFGKIIPTAQVEIFYAPRSTVRLSVLDSLDKHTVFSVFLAWGTPPVFGHRKSLRRISPTKAAFILFPYCDYNTLVFNSQRDNVGHLRTFTDIFKIFLPERLELPP